jgi:hypothetical protein
MLGIATLCAADTRLEHSAAPDRNTVIAADIMQGTSFPVPADPAEFDVDDLARAQLDCLSRIVRRVNRFVENKWASQSALKLGVIDDPHSEAAARTS